MAEKVENLAKIVASHIVFMINIQREHMSENTVCYGACRIRHLVHVAIPVPHCHGVLAKSLCR